MASRSGKSRVHRLEFDVEWPPGHVACYLVEGPEPVLVDTAMPQDEGALSGALVEHGCTPAEIDHLLITHPHVDHIGGVPELLEDADPTIYAPAGVQARFNRGSNALGERVRKNCLQAGFSGEQLEEAVEMAVESLERDSTLLSPETVDTWLDPGATMDIGDCSIEAVHLPGHQADHFSYATEIDAEKLLLAGDMGIESFRPVVIHDGLDDGYRDAFPAFFGALDRMAELDVDSVYPAHGPVHQALDSVIARDRLSLDDRLEQVCNLVAEGHRTASAIVNAIADDADINYLLIPETMSALAYLESTGRLSADQIDGISHYRNPTDH